MQLEFLNPVIIQLLAFVVDRYDPETTILSPFLKPFQGFGQFNALPVNKLLKIFPGEITRVIKYYGVQVLVERDAANFIYIEYKIVQGIHLIVIEVKLFRRFFARFMPPAIAEQNPADVEKKDLYGCSFQGCLNFAFLIFYCLQ